MLKKGTKMVATPSLRSLKCACVGRVVVSLLAFVAFGQLKPAHANIFADVWRVVTDPLKLQSASKEVSDGVYRTMLQAEQLETQANKDITERLKQVQDIVNDALSGLSLLENKAVNDMNNLEQQINYDANQFLYNLSCEAETTLNDSLQRAWDNMINQLGNSRPGISIFGFRLFNIGPTVTVSILDPDKSYWTLKEKVLTGLRTNQKEDSLAYNILSAYQNLERTAKLTVCYYKGQPEFRKKFIQEANNLEIMTLEWTSVVNVTNPVP